MFARFLTTLEILTRTIFERHKIHISGRPDNLSTVPVGQKRLHLQILFNRAFDPVLLRRRLMDRVVERKKYPIAFQGLLHRLFTGFQKQHK
jgi:hypothetical protein